MIQIIEIENPFERRKKSSESVYIAKSLVSYVDCTGRDIFINGHCVEQKDIGTTIPQDGDQIIVVPHIASGGIGKILGFVAMIALTVYSGNIAGGLWAKAGGFFAKGAVGSFLAAGAVMYLGGRLINAVFPQQSAALDTSWQEDKKVTTYGWDLPTPNLGEGGIIGETYGSCIPSPQLLEQHVETVGDKQYLNLIYCGGYGPVDNIDKIRIDYTDISNFTGATVETRLGTNEQEPISFFTDTPLDQSIGLEMEVGSPLIRTSNSTRATKLDITIEWPGGLYHLNDSGGYDTVSVVFSVSYKKTGAVDWINLQNITASGASASAIRNTYIVASGLPAGQYDVRVEAVSKPTGSRYCTTTQWSIMTSYINGVYSRPNKVLVALRILATNQLSGGVPNLTWRQTRSMVYVWNPNMSSYETRPASNPIWAAYDIMHGCRKIKNINTNTYEYVVRGAPASALSAYYDEWEAAAAYADEEILNPNGEKEKRFEFDAYFDTEQKRISAAQKAASVGHAVIIRHGRNYGIVVDRPGDITQIFGEGRTTVSSIKGTFSSKDERARAVEITYNDRQNDYKNTMFTVRSNSYNSDVYSQDNTAKLTLFGISRRSQAYREAVTTLATNERQLQFIELSADIDAIVAEYGDIVGFNHEVSRTGIASGRIVSATASTVKLDKEITMISSLTYEIYIQLSNDELVKRAIVAADTTINTLTLVTPFDDDKIPQQYDNYAVGETGKSVKPYRIVNASRDGDLLVKLKLAEYDAAIYATELDYSKYPVVDYTPQTTYGAQNLSVKEKTYVQNDGSMISDIEASWSTMRGSSEDTYHIYSGEKDSTMMYQGSSATGFFTVQGVRSGITYTVAVRGVYGGIEINSRTADVYITGKDSVPNNITRFDVVQSGEDIIAIIDEVTDKDIQCYELRQGIGWGASNLIGIFTGNKYEFPATDEGTLTFWVKAKDKTGNYSDTAAKAICNVSNLPVRNIMYERDISFDSCTITGMYRKMDGTCQIADKKIISDYDRFSDMFGSFPELQSDAEILLPVIDLGENMIDESCFWTDHAGNKHLRTTQTMADFTRFSDMFGADFSYVKMKYQNSTFLTASVKYSLDGSAKYTVEYRTSIDAVNWSGWMPENIKQFAGRYVQVHIVPQSLDGYGNIIIKSLSVKIDVPDLEDIIENIALSNTADTTIKFNKKFQEIKSFAAYTDYNGKQVTCKMSNYTGVSIDVSALDDSGERIAATLQKLVIRGY